MSRRAPEPEKPENHERWIVTYADMVTLLFALFVVLWSMSDANATKLEQVRTSLDKAFNVGVLSGTDGASPVFEGGGGLTPSLSEIKSNDLVAITKEVGEAGAQGGYGSKVQVRSDAESITISLADNLLFDSGSADLKPGSQAVLADVAAVLAELPNRIRIEGHTDNVPVNSPDYDSNWELSAARASTVLRYLSENGHIDATRMFLAGFADTAPIAGNATPEGRALNRRADIVIVYPSQAELEEALAAAGKVKDQ
ncbi:MAG: flagellar motor protein MotB [Dehalococcoidia bacterium]|nr:flagellar motor protein MotB [Dehalococcoidia bacterium]